MRPIIGAMPGFRLWLLWCVALVAACGTGATRECEPGALYIIPPNVPHRAVALGGPCVVLDVFSPVREDYAALANKYIPVPKPNV